MDFGELKNRHNRLLEVLNQAEDRSELAPKIHQHLQDIAQSGEAIFLNSERELLLADIRFWSSVLFDIERKYPEVQLSPVRPEFDLANRLKRFRQSLRSRSSLREASAELDKISYLVETQSPGEQIEGELYEARELLRYTMEERRTLLDSTRQGDIQTLQTAAQEIKRLMLQGVREFYDEGKQGTVTIEQVMAGIQARLDIQKVKDELQQRLEQVVTISDLNFNQWQEKVIQLEQRIDSASESAAFLGSDFEREIQELQDATHFLRHWLDRSRKRAEVAGPAQKAYLLRDAIKEIEHFLPVIFPYDFSKRLRALGTEQAPAVFEQARQMFEQGNYLEAVNYGDLVLYFTPQNEAARFLTRRAKTYRDVQDALDRIQHNYQDLRNESNQPAHQYLGDELRKLGVQLSSFNSPEFGNRWRKLTSLPYQSLINPAVWEQTNEWVYQIALKDLPASETPSEITHQIMNLLSTWLSEARLAALSGETLVQLSVSELGSAYQYARRQSEQDPNTENTDWQILAIIKNEFTRQMMAFGKKRLDMLRDANQREDYAEAEAISRSLEEYEKRFPELINDTGSIQAVYFEVRQLRNRIMHQQEIQQVSLSILREAETALLDGNPEQAEKILNSASIRDDLPERTAKHVHDLRNRIQHARSAQNVQQWRHSLEVFRLRLKFVSKPKELKQLIQDLGNLAKETDLNHLPDEERQSYEHFMGELLEFNSALSKAEAWKKAATLAKKRKNTEETLACLQRALDELGKYPAAQIDVQKQMVAIQSQTFHPDTKNGDSNQ